MPSWRMTDSPGSFAMSRSRSNSRDRTKGVAKELHALCRVQLGRTDFFFPAAHGDGRAAGSAQIAYPVDLAPGAPDPTPA